MDLMEYGACLLDIVQGRDEFVWFCCWEDLA